MRLIGLDTPETKDPRKPVEYFGKGGQPGHGQRVRLEIQTVPTSRDRYGRLLAYVFRESDNPLVNKEIIRGVRTRLHQVPLRFGPDGGVRAAEREARDYKRGLWGPWP